LSQRDLLRVCEILDLWPHAWWIAGGWAIDLHLSTQSRGHHDVDVAVLRRDQLNLQTHLADWGLSKVANRSLAPWPAGEVLSPPVHEIHAVKGEEHLEFLLNDARADTWHFRRNNEISMPLAELTRRSASGIPYLCPQVVLLYKAKHPRPVDEDDFGRVLSRLKQSEREWLKDALEVCHPGHQWLRHL